MSVAASYPHDVAERFVQFLARGGIEVVNWASHEIYTVAEVGTQQVLQMVHTVGVDAAAAILVPDTAMHSLAWVDNLETTMGKPVPAANQVTIWEGLRIAEAFTSLSGLGSLLRVAPADDPIILGAAAGSGEEENRGGPAGMGDVGGHIKWEG